MSGWGSPAPQAGAQRGGARDPQSRLASGLQAIAQQTGDMQAIARRLSRAPAPQSQSQSQSLPQATQDRKAFVEKMSRTQETVADVERTLEELRPTLPKAQYDKLAREVAQARGRVDEMATRGKRIVNDMAAADAPSSPSSAVAHVPGDEMVELKEEDPQKRMIEERNAEMARLAEDMGALQEIMRDTHQLAVEQGVTLDVAADNVKAAKAETKDATVELASAEKLSQKRRLMIAIIVVVSIIIVIAIILIILKALHVI